jgi:hypothetical protein
MRVAVGGVGSDIEGGSSSRYFIVVAAGQEGKTKQAHKQRMAPPEQIDVHRMSANHWHQPQAWVAHHATGAT